MQEDFVPLADAQKRGWFNPSIATGPTPPVVNPSITTGPNPPQQADFVPLEEAKKKGWLDRPIIPTEGITVKVPNAPKTPRELFHQGLISGLRSIDPVLTGTGVAMGTLGTAPVLGPYSPLAGVAAGAAVSDATRTAIEGLTGQSEPSFMGRQGVVPTGGILDRLYGALGDTAISVTGDALTNKVVNPLSSALLDIIDKFGGSKTKTAFAAHPNVPASYSQLTGNPLAERLESIFAPKAKAEQIRASVAAATKDAQGLTKDLAEFRVPDPSGSGWLNPYALIRSYNRQKNGDLDVAIHEAVTKTPDALKRAIAEGLDRKAAGGLEFQNIVTGAWNPEKGNYDFNALVKKWEDPDRQEMYRLLYNAKDRANISQMLEVLKNTSQSSSKAGLPSMAIQLGKAGMYLTGAGLTGKLFAGGLSPYELAALGIVSGTVGLNQFARKVLLNDNVARAAALGLKTPATSSQAQFVGNTILGALKGVGIALQTKDGKTIQGYVDQDGSIKLDKNGPPTPQAPAPAPTVNVNPKAAENFNLDDTIKTLREGFSK